MSRRSTILLPSSHDGTSQRHRALPALDPRYAAIDERSSADLVAFVQALVERLRYWSADAVADQLREEGTWQAFANKTGLTVADIAAYAQEPERFTGDEARWLGRPHFALLLTFIELLGHAREQLSDLTRRHLEFHFNDILHMQAEAAEPDRAAVIFKLANRVGQLRLPVGTALQAGRDSSGVARIYRTEREVVLNRAHVDELRSVYVNRRITGIPDVRKDRSLTARGTLESMLRLALGVPKPGDPIPQWKSKAIDVPFLVGLRAPLDLAWDSLFLEHHELRTLMQRVRRRQSADQEWAEINKLLGKPNPAKPRDFNANFEAAVGKLDYKADGLPQVDNVDDLYIHRSEPDVRAYIDAQLAEIGYDNFVALMPIKLRIDAEWAEINRLLERAGRRQRGLLVWTLETNDPTAFDANLAKALAGQPAPKWPWGTKSIYEYEAELRGLEGHMAMVVEHLDRLVAFAEQLGDSSAAEDFEWTEVDSILAAAHSESVYARRRAVLDEVRAGRDNLVGFDWVATYVLSRPGDMPEQPFGWDVARPKLEQHLDKGQLDVLDRFRDQLGDPALARVYTWADVYRVLELAQRYIENMPEPVALLIEWRNLYAYADATSQLDDAGTSPRWKTFGGLPVADEHHPPEPNLGFALRS